MTAHGRGPCHGAHSHSISQSCTHPHPHVAVHTFESPLQTCFQFNRAIDRPIDAEVSSCWLCVQITGPTVVPFDTFKQTALLSIIDLRLPRIAAGIGPFYTQEPSIQDFPTTNTSRATLIMISTDRPRKFAQVGQLSKP